MMLMNENKAMSNFYKERKFTIKQSESIYMEND